MVVGGAVGAMVLGWAVAAVALPVAELVPVASFSPHIEWSNCGDVKKQLCPSLNISIDPDPVHPGAMMDIKMFCDAEVETSAGFVEAQVFVGSRKLETKEEPYCWTTQCPSKPGKRLHELVTYIPNEVPKGISVTINFEAKDTDKNVIFCSVVHFKVN